jgi:ketosteroid isomerase-like protein
VTSSAEAQIELVRKAIDAFNRRDTDAMIALAPAEGFEYDWTRSIAPNRGIYRGIEGMKEFVEDQWSAFEEVRIEPSEYLARGRHVVVPATVHGRGRGRGGVAVSANSAQVFTFENGRLMRITLYQGREEALAAASK